MVAVVIEQRLLLNEFGKENDHTYFLLRKNCDNL